MFEEFALDTLEDPEQLDFINDDEIPQFDGPIDDENMKAGQSSDPDLTIERKVFVACQYKSATGRNTPPITVTPRKKRRVSSGEDELASPNAKKKVNEILKSPRTPHRKTPSKRLNKLTSPSCPSRTYSPLSLEIIHSPKTSKNSPSTSPRKPVKMLQRKKIFPPSPVKESNLGILKNVHSFYNSLKFNMY